MEPFVLLVGQEGKAFVIFPPRARHSPFLGALLSASPSILRAQDAPSPVFGGTITASMDLEPASLHPLFGNAATSDRFIFNQLFDALLRIEEDGTLSPALATEWAYGEGNTSIILKLRAGVSFLDGEEFNADAAKANRD